MKPHLLLSLTISLPLAGCTSSLPAPIATIATLDHGQTQLAAHMRVAPSLGADVQALYAPGRTSFVGVLAGGGGGNSLAEPHLRNTFGYGLVTGGYRLDHAYKPWGFVLGLEGGAGLSRVEASAVMALRDHPEESPALRLVPDDKRFDVADSSLVTEPGGYLLTAAETVPTAVVVRSEDLIAMCTPEGEIGPPNDDCTLGFTLDVLGPEPGDLALRIGAILKADDDQSFPPEAKVSFEIGS